MVDAAEYLRVSSMAHREPSGLPSRELTMADKSPKKSTSKTAASKSLKEKRADKKTKAANKPTG
jgi:hypothetical protein